ncbi:OmpA family protein [Maribacter sp. 2-571]|uniref:OmpA family protein n=1 Tax=Maribacter sp. 2-571 TaxID=3417569 RepID=UPI003D350360
MKKFLIYSIFLCTLLGSAQEKYKSADKNFESLWYVKAAEQYEGIIARGDDSQEALQRIGDAYYFNTDMKNASKWYGTLFSKHEQNLSPTYAFRYIHALKGIGEYNLAKGLMKVYEGKMKDKSFDVEQLRKNDKKMDYLLTQQPQFYITHLPMNTKVADFGAMFYKERVVFASSRDTLKFRTRIYKWNEQPFLNLFVADTLENGTDFKNVAIFSKTINSKYHEAIVAFTPDGKTMYFTRNNYSEKTLGKDDNGINHLKLYKADLENETWGNITEVPFNSENYSVGQPAISPDGKQLYFVSDMPGSIGSTDIFVVDILEDGNYSTPKNLGPKINTSGREMFPFLTTNKLYFASDGHLGLGGLDVFESVYPDNQFSNPVNVGRPLNSRLDDFAYIVNERTQRGYFSSNREGGTGDDDIYSFQRFEPVCEQDLVGKIVNEQNGLPIPYAKVTVVDEEGNELDETTTDQSGDYDFDLKLKCDQKYTVKVTKEGFDHSSKVFASPTQNGFTNNLPLGLKKRNELIVEENGLLKIKIGIIFFDFDESYITKSAASELNKVVFVMNEYPNMVIKIESHTDSRGNDTYNEKLSDRRAKATREFLIKQGIAAERLESAIGYGEKQLMNDCDNNTTCSDRQHDLNRRSEFIILKME